LEQKMKGTMNVKPKVKVERFEDDQKREGRQAERVGTNSTLELMIRAWKEGQTRILITISTRTSKTMTMSIHSTGTMTRRKRPSCKM
jgi:hypothetical protein